MKAAALADLPVHSGRPFVVALHPVNAQVRLSADRAFGINKRQRKEKAAVLVPELYERYLSEIDVGLTVLENRSMSCPLCSELQARPADVPIIPQSTYPRRDYRLGKLYGAANKFLRPCSEREIDPLVRPEKVGHQRKLRALNISEQ